MQVKIIKDSINLGHRLTTFEISYWRAIHSEVIRHRCFSHCVESSRAKPVKYNIEQVLNHPFVPKYWTSNKAGMVGDLITDPEQIARLEKEWKSAAYRAAKTAQYFIEHENVHKQIANRILEPYLLTKQVIAGTEWDNFFKLRTAEDAEPHIRELALAMKHEMDLSVPVKREGLHLPYISDEEFSKIVQYSIDNKTKEHPIQIAKKVSAARCARCSVKAFDGTTSIEKDLALADKLIKLKHFSPFEFVATPCSDKNLCGNYVGWMQFRKELELG